MTSHEWQPSVFLGGDIAEKLIKLKQEPGPDLHVYRSENLLQLYVCEYCVPEFEGIWNGNTPALRTRNLSPIVLFKLLRAEIA
jgi:hypothetical protein